MANNFQVDRAKHKNGIMDIYNPDGYEIQKESDEKVSRFQRLLGVFIQYLSLWRMYPDLFIDMITPADSKFKLYFYQRVFLRAIFRHKYVYATFTRAFSKSFLSIMALYLKCILYPRIKLFVCSGGKEQAANIAKEKIEELWELFPALQKEIKYHQFSKDYVKLVFHNGSKLDIVAVQNSTRGGRRHAGLMEEVILIDGQKLNEVIIPLMNVDRRSMNGDVDPNEPHKSQIYVTTAGYKNTFAYQKMIQLLVWMVVKGNAFVFGGDWRIPVMHNLLNQDFVEELKEDGTYNELSFAREYESIWSGTSEDAFFNSDLIDRNRILKVAEHQPNIKVKGTFYVVSCDVARVAGKQNADTVSKVFKCVPRGNGTYMVHIVNTVLFKAEHFETQSIKLKKLVFKYNAKQLVVDANGLGIGLVDYLVKRNIEEETGEVFPPFSVTNDEEYDKYKTRDSLPLLYNVKAQTFGAGNISVNCLSQISSGKVKFLVSETVAKSKLLSTKNGQKLSSEETAKHLAPFVLTSIMKEQMMNLKQEGEGKNVGLKRITKKIQKDFFSALEYGLWYIKELEDKNIDEDDEEYDFCFFLN